MGTQSTMRCRKFEFIHTREGFQRFEQTLRNHLVNTRGQRLLIALEPSGSSWQALYERLQGCGYEVCLVHCQAVRNNRKTMQAGTSKTDATDAYSVFALLRQGKCFLPVARDPELKAAYRLMQRHMALKKRVRQRRNQLRAALHLAFPELHPLIQDLTQPTALRFLQTPPTPATVLHNGRTGFLEQCQRRRRCGQWRSDTFNTIYDLAPASIGRTDPYHLDAFEITALAQDLADALAKHQMYLDKVLERLAHRPAFQLLLTLPRIGRPTAAAILTAIGDIGTYTNGTQLVKLAGLAIRLFERGSSMRQLPPISHVGSAYLRYWLYHYAKRLVAHEPHCRA